MTANYPKIHWRGGELDASAEKLMRKPVRMIQLGGGHHPFRTIIPHALEMRCAGINVTIPVVVDLETARETVTKRKEKLGKTGPELVFLSPDSPYTLDARTEAGLNRLVRKYQINAAVVSVPPEAHFALAQWALRSGLSVFLDKPITIRPDAVNSPSAARGIADDYAELMAAYDTAIEKAPVCAVVNAQRPFIPIYALAQAKVAEVLHRTGQPVSNITACHADGQLRIGGELIDNAYHGFRNGYGKSGHSGYHLIDWACRILKAGTGPEHRPDYLLVRSTLVQPDALAMSMPRQRWCELFGADHESVSAISDQEIIALGRRMGEVDAHIMIEAIRDGAVITTMNLHLQHNTVSMRASANAPENWYKESGRLKRELWHVDSGFAQSIRIETLQAEDKHDRQGAKGDLPGDPNHLDMICVRNERLIGSGARFEKVSAGDLTSHGSDQLHAERGKMAALAEFVACAQGRITREDLTSDLSVHHLGVNILSAVYLSHIERGASRTGSGVVRVEWQD